MMDQFLNQLIMNWSITDRPLDFMNWQKSANQSQIISQENPGYPCSTRVDLVSHCSRGANTILIVPLNYFLSPTGRLQRPWINQNQAKVGIPQSCILHCSTRTTNNKRPKEDPKIAIKLAWLTNEFGHDESAKFLGRRFSQKNIQCAIQKKKTEPNPGL